MAKATVTRSEATVTLELTGEEAVLLRSLIGRHVSGRQGTWRSVSDHICDALRDAGVPAVLLPYSLGVGEINASEPMPPVEF